MKHLMMPRGSLEVHMDVRITESTKVGMTYQGKRLIVLDEWNEAQVTR